MYDPDGMENPCKGTIENDHFDEQIPWMNYIIYADEINDAWARNLRTRYFGEITYIDTCIGKILDAVEEREDADNTMICFFADHGDMLGDHQAWQKECFYEPSVKIPFIVSYPSLFERNTRSKDLVSLTDLFGLATSLAGKRDLRDGIDLVQNRREFLFSFYGRPETRRFKVMVRSGNWKYIYMANGNREQLFDLDTDSQEMINLLQKEAEVAKVLRKKAVEKCMVEPDLQCMVKDNDFVGYSFEARPLGRLHQFAFSRNITNFTVPSGKGFMSEALPN
jgi:choline-sulfatase